MAFLTPDLEEHQCLRLQPRTLFSYGVLDGPSLLSMLTLPRDPGEGGRRLLCLQPEDTVEDVLSFVHGILGASWLPNQSPAQDELLCPSCGSPSQRALYSSDQAEQL